MSTLEAETDPWAGQVGSVLRVDAAHAASSSLLGEPEGKQEPIQSRSQCHPEATNAATRLIHDFA